MAMGEVGVAMGVYDMCVRCVWGMCCGVCMLSVVCGVCVCVCGVLYVVSGCVWCVVCVVCGVCVCVRVWLKHLTVNWKGCRFTSHHWRKILFSTWYPTSRTTSWGRTPCAIDCTS